MKTIILPWTKKRSGSSLAAPLLAISLCPMSLIGEVTPEQLDHFASNIDRAFRNRCTGFGYSIYQNGSYAKGDGGGFRYKSDHPLTQLPFDQHTQKDCHSMSKTITAAAMIRALQLRGIGLDARIYSYFPKKFQQKTPNPAIKLITFEEMLAHRSGFGDSAKTWDQLLDELKDGRDYVPEADDEPDVDGDGKNKYCNWNYGMCRLLIPYVLYTSTMREAENKVSSSKIAAACADLYIRFTRDWILTPAGATRNRTRPPKDPLAVNFAYLYDWRNHSKQGIMPNRRLDIGSGGWAMSSRAYGRFLASLFAGDLLDDTVKVGGATVNTLDYMKEKNLGMWKVTGSSGETYYQHRGANSWDPGVGGKSVWMYYPPTKMLAVVIVNSRRNDTTAAGVQRQVLLSEAYDEAHSIPRPSEFANPQNIFCSRQHDGWILGRGVGSTGGLQARNFDQDVESNWSITRFFDTSKQTFMLRYNRDNGDDHGSLMIQKVRPDGTLGELVYSSSNWSRNWSQMEIFHTNDGKDTFLACYRRSDGKFRTYRIANDGNPVGSAISDAMGQANFNVMKIVRLNGKDHLFRHNSFNGFTHIRILNDDGSWGAAVYEKTWKSGFPSMNFYQTGNSNTFILRYNPVGGQAKILRFDSTVSGIDQTTVLLDQTWSENWLIIRFFETANGTFNFRYNPINGKVRIQKVKDNGIFDSDGLVLDNNDDWLRGRTADGPFRPATTGWDTIEFYHAREIAGEPKPPRASTKPPRASMGVDEDGRLSTPPPGNPRIPELKPASIELDQRPEGLHFSWQSQSNELYFIESSNNLRGWEPIDLIPGTGGSLSWSTLFQSGQKENERRQFFRVRTIEGAPE